MKRRILQFFVATSLLLTVLIAVLWVRSIWVADAVGWTHSAPTPISDMLWSSDGIFSFRRWAPPANPFTLRDSPPGWFHWHQPPEVMGIIVIDRNPHRFCGVVYYDNKLMSPGNPFHGTREIVLRVPYWLLLALIGMWPLAEVLARRRRAARATNSRCPTCGYDLRATPERCPECGTATVAE